MSVQKKEGAMLYVLWCPVLIIILLSSSGPNGKQISVIISYIISNPVCPVLYCNNRTGKNSLGRLFARLVLLFFILVFMPPWWSLWLTVLCYSGSMLEYVGDVSLGLKTNTTSVDLSRTRTLMNSKFEFSSKL